MHGLKTAILAILPEIGWIGLPFLVKHSIFAHRKWPEMVVSASTNQVRTKITIRSFAWSFAIQNQIQAVRCPNVCTYLQPHYGNGTFCTLSQLFKWVEMNLTFPVFFLWVCNFCNISERKEGREKISANPEFFLHRPEAQLCCQFFTGPA